MIFTSIHFVFFFLPIVLLGNMILQKRVWLQNLFLILVSLVFYGWSDPKLIILIIISIVLNYCTALSIGNIRTKKVRLTFLLIGITFNIGMLVYFKYAGWCWEILNKILRRETEAFEIMLPLGISFYTFQALSYVIDVYRRDVKVQKNVFVVALYILMFPQLVAGPIVRYAEIELQICSARRFFAEDFSDGVERFIKGFSKKVLLADSFSVMADKAFSLNALGELDTTMAWLGGIAYALQIYYDFSGYSDMAVGLGKMLGFTYPENFNYPYIANSITDFWRRWHMSLSTWFRDYVYIPLGGNRKGRMRTIINQAVTWLSTGLWHGANFTFLIWGGLNGGLLAAERATKIPQLISRKRVVGIVYRLFTIILIVLCWVMFRAESVTEAFRYYHVMFNFRKLQGNVETALFYLHIYRSELFLGVLLCTPIVSKLFDARVKLLKILKDIVMLVCFLVSISYVIKGTYSPFIYFNF